MVQDIGTFGAAPVWGHVEGPVGRGPAGRRTQKLCQRADVLAAIQIAGSVTCQLWRLRTSAAAAKLRRTAALNCRS